MTEVGKYLDEVKSRLATSLAIKFVDVVSERNTSDRGYFRSRLLLANDDFIEISEYFTFRGGKLETIEYRYQWMKPEQDKLVRRWDNARHHPELPNFPHHVHMGEENQVMPGQALSTLDLIDVIEQELGYK